MKTIIIDSREQKYTHITNYFDNNGIKWISSKMYVGDYQLLSNGLLVVDRKSSILEIAKNIMSKDHQRFKDECQRAMDNGIKLVILIEEPYTLAALCDWESPKFKSGKLKGNPITKISGKSLSNAMKTIIMRYGVRFEFCEKENTAQRIIDILTNKTNV